MAWDDWLIDLLISHASNVHVDDRFHGEHDSERIRKIGHCVD